MLDRRQFVAAGVSAAFAGPDPIARAVAEIQARASGARFAKLFGDGLYPDSEAGRAQAVAEMNRRVARLRPRLTQAFDMAVPAAEVRAAPAGKAGYREPGAYYVDLSNIRSRPAWTLASVAFHETVPGHLLQLAVQGRTDEGWSTYAEELAAALGAYCGDPMGEAGFLHWRMFRLARAVVDRGLSQQGWSRARAVEEMTTLMGHPIAFVTIEADVDRIAARPGQVTGEALRALELTANRPHDRTQWPAYHRAVLTA